MDYYRAEIHSKGTILAEAWSGKPLNDILELIAKAGKHNEVEVILSDAFNNTISSYNLNLDLIYGFKPKDERK